MTAALCLALVDLADTKLVLQVNIDAFKVAVGSVLLHVDGSGNHPISYFSRKLSETEQRYSTTDREMLAIEDSLRHFKHMLLGHAFWVCTDHRPLIMYFSKSRELTAHEAHW